MTFLINIIAFFANMLDAYLLYRISQKLCSAKAGFWLKKLAFVLLLATATFATKVAISLSALTLGLNILLAFLIVFVFFGFSRMSFVSIIVWFLIVILAEFVSFSVLSFFSVDTMLSALHDDNLMSLSGIFISKLLECAIIYVVFIRDGSIKAAKSYSFSIIILFSLTFILLFCVCLEYYWTISGTDATEPFILFFSVVIVAFLMSAFYTNRQALKIEREKEDNARIEMQKDFFETLHNSIEIHREIMHDTRHHIQLIQTMFGQGDFDTARKYAEELAADVDNLQIDIITNQPIISSLILRFRELALAQNIVFKYDIPNYIRTDIADTDICVVLSNLLENAFEACVNSDVKTVTLRIYVQFDLLFINLENSIAPNTSLPKSSRPLLSTKQSLSEHGYGLRSVVRLVSKYNGILKYGKSAAQDTFEVDISLPLSCE